MLEKHLTNVTVCDKIKVERGDYMFAENLKLLRKTKGLTQTQFASTFNISTGTIAMWETGKRMPDSETLKRIAQFFNVSIDYLLDNEKKLPDEFGSLDDVYFSLAKELQDKEIDPDDIRIAIETIKTLKSKKAGDPS